MYEFLDYQVQDVMSKPVAVAPDATLAEVERLLEEHDWNGMPVVAHGRLVGFVTSLDLLAAFDFSPDSTLPPYEQIMQRHVASVMTRHPETVTPRTPLTRVLTKLVETRAKSFAVVDPDDRLVGMVAREDVMRAILRANAGESPGA